MADMGSHNPNQRNVDEFGGVPFVPHLGNHCHRGTNPFKKSDFHPSETAKRVIYKEDGSGRDTYISSNSGGLTVTNQSGVNGTDVQALYSQGLRGYGKDTVSPGYQRLPVALRVDDDYIEKTLALEDADYGKKHAQKLQNVLQNQHHDALKTASTQKNRAAESVGAFPKQNPIDTMLGSNTHYSPKGAGLQMGRNFESGYKTQQVGDYSNSAHEIKGLLKDMNVRLTKQDLYFRNQEKLMQNANISDAQKQMISQKMRFQTKHSDILAQPKKVTEKYEMTQEKINEQSWTYSKTNRVSAHKGMGSGSQSPMARGLITDRYAGLGKNVRKLEIPNEPQTDPSKVLRALLRNKPQD